MWRVTESDTNGNTDTNSYSHVNAYNYNDAQAVAYTAASTDTKASPDSATAPLGCKISWLDSGTRERKLASFCLWIERTVLF